MRKNISIAGMILLSFMFLFSSCKKENENEETPGPYAGNTIFIVNEGVFQTGTGALSVFNRDDGTTTNDVFMKANGWPLGNVLQSVTVYGNNVYMAVNNANIIEVADALSFESIATIEDVTSPRYFVAHDTSKGYISCWDNMVRVIDLSTFTVTKEIECGTGPDRMIISGDNLMVLNIGGFSNDSTVTVIDMESDLVSRTIQVGDNPSGIAKDKEGDIWVLCAGKGWNGFPQAGDTEGRIVKIDQNSLDVVASYEFPDNSKHPNQLEADKAGDKLYYNYTDGIYAFDLEQPAIQSTPLVSSTVMYYGLGFDPVSQLIYATDPVDYVQNGKVLSFNTDGSKVNEFGVGIIPNGFYFNLSK